MARSTACWRRATPSAGLGDREVVQQALTVATELAARSGDDVAQRRVQAFRSQWMVAPLT